MIPKTMIMMMMIVLLQLLVFVPTKLLKVVSAASTTTQQQQQQRRRPELWYEDNNNGQAAGMTRDFKRMFDDPIGIAEWTTARSQIDVYMIRSNTLLNNVNNNNITIDWLRTHFQSVLNGKPVALDVTGATWLSSSSSSSSSSTTTINPHRLAVAKRELKLLIDMIDVGVNVQYISMQSVLSKPLPQQQPPPPQTTTNITRVNSSSSSSINDNKNNINYNKNLVDSLQQRYEGIATYMNLILNHDFFQNPARNITLKWGIIDARPSKGWEWQDAYYGLKIYLKEHNLPSLDHIHLDIPSEIPNGIHRPELGITWTTIRQVENYVTSSLMGCDFGLVSTSKIAGYTSDKAFHDAVIDIPYQYRTNRYLIMSWFPHPTYSIPENPLSIHEYPVMKTVLNFSTTITSMSIENHTNSVGGGGDGRRRRRRRLQQEHHLQWK